MSEWTPDDGPDASRVAWLFASIARLAAPAAVQIRYLKDQLPSVDELGLEFDDEFALLTSFVEAGWVPARQGALIERLDETLGEISNDDSDEMWTQAALESAPEWALIRQRAWDVLTFSE